MNTTNVLTADERAALVTFDQARGLAHTAAAQYYVENLINCAFRAGRVSAYTALHNAYDRIAKEGQLRLDIEEAETGMFSPRRCFEVGHPSRDHFERHLADRIAAVGMEHLYPEREDAADFRQSNRKVA
jgi:hypothetical protein